MKNKHQMLLEVEQELQRFQKRLTDAIEDSKTDAYVSTKFASCKRSAMDLKKELTKITQSSKYLWND